MLAGHRSPPPIFGPVHPDLLRAVVVAWKDWMGLPAEAIMGAVIDRHGFPAICRWLGCAPIHERTAVTWSILSLRAYVVGVMGGS